MGGDSYCSSLFSTEDVSLLLDQHSPHQSINSSGGEECLRHYVENNNSVIDASCGEFHDARKTWIDDEAAEPERSYEDFQPRIDRLEEAKHKILSYTPGSFAENAPYVDPSDYDIPNATSLLLIGPKASGKSSLVNKISRLLEGDIFLPPRAQVSCNSSCNGDGTFFLHEYIIPRGSGSFCLYDTRGLSADSSENFKMIRRWMTKGVCHGELITRKSDSMALKAQLKCKGRWSFFSTRATGVGFVIFVVNGLTVLESMNSSDEKKKEYSQSIAANFNNPLLSFKDDKPAVVVTHGDLLKFSDRVRVRAYLGELLGIPPTGQIFDIPENNDPTTAIAISDMLIYCLERADRNLPAKDMFADKVCAVASLFFWIIAAIFVVFGIPSLQRGKPSPPPFKVALDVTPRLP